MEEHVSYHDILSKIQTIPLKKNSENQVNMNVVMQKHDTIFTRGRHKD